jgi:TonB family protein
MFYLSAPRPGVYLVRLEVAGVLPAISAPIRLNRDAFEQRRIALDIVPNVPVYSGQLQREVRPFPNNRPPQYPAALNFRDREGEVILEFVVDSGGSPILATARVVRSSDSLFTASALRALASYRFDPAQANDHPVAALVQLPFHFRLPSGRCQRGPDSLTGRQPDELCNRPPM